MKTLIFTTETQRYGSDRLYMFIRALGEAGDECTLRTLPDTFDELDIGSVEGYDRLVIAGDDDVIAKLLWSLKRFKVPLCVFPSGNTNLYFSALGNAAEPEAIARACKADISVPCDLAEMMWADPQGNMHTSGFAIMSGTGFDARLMQGAIPTKKIMGNASYFIAALSNPHPTVVDFEIDADGTISHHKGIACIIANTATLIAGIEIVHDAAINDGKLNCIVLETPDAIGLLRPFFRGLIDHTGKHLGRPTIVNIAAQNIRVKASSPVPMQIDGSLVGYDVDRFAARVLPHVNNVIVDPLSRYYPS